ncbi:MAG: class I SAM-dependent methyltransferase [Lentisphaerae bacterium]|nr:class I SAM-dependent methyltransferase [Lentisphaerota bacterium]
MRACSGGMAGMSGAGGGGVSVMAERTGRDAGGPSDIVGRIAALPRDWHRAGSLHRRVLEAMERNCRTVSPMEHTLETGSGKSTLLFSNMSRHHLVFSLDKGESLSRARESGLLRAESVEFVEGPTQITLPAYKFDFKLQAALIDGPHAYPFPDLEYYCIYPRLAEGALLILDDIDIPTIARMFGILKADAMFELVEVVKHTAFFRRTDRPLHDPLGDGWWQQGFNRPLYDKMLRKKKRRERRKEGWWPFGHRTQG